MNNSYAKVVLDSVGPNKKRIISVECRYWRAIHSEIMTHRDRARNAASSRAIPFIRRVPCTCQPDPKYCAPDCPRCQGSGKMIVENCTYSRILNDSFMPEFMGAEQKGMQSGGELQEPNRANCLASIARMRDFCLAECEYLFEQGLHKSVINRYLEPWSYITVIMTATEWKNFFRLRVHPKAEKHFNKVAGQIQDAIKASRPQELLDGDWHMPYLQNRDYEEVYDSPDTTEIVRRLGVQRYIASIWRLKRISAARCARLSYLTQDGVRDHAADMGLFESLIHPKIDADRDDDVIHSSPLEHVNQASNDPSLRSGCMNGWFQFRKEFANENVEG